MTEDGQRARVLLVHWGRNGGGPRYHLGLVAAMRDAGTFEVHASWSRQADVADRLRGLGVAGCAVDTFHGPWSSLRVDRLLRAAWRLRRYVIRQRIDAVVVSMPQVWQAAALWLLPRSVPVLLTVHDAHEHPGESLPVRLTRPGTTWLELARADGIVCLSTSVARTVRERLAGSRPVVTSVHAVDAPAAAPREHPGDRPVVGFFGRLLAYKGVDLLVDAVPELRRRFPGLTVRIHGHGPVHIPATPGVELHRGWVADADIGTIVAAFDVLVLPYREASQSGVLGLATSQGIPIVATPVGGLSEQISLTGAGVLATAVTPDAIAAAVGEVLATPARYAQLSAAGLASAAGTLSWRRVAEDYTSAVELALGAERPPAPPTGERSRHEGVPRSCGPLEREPQRARVPRPDGGEKMTAW